MQNYAIMILIMENQLFSDSVKHSPHSPETEELLNDISNDTSWQTQVNRLESGDIVPTKRTLLNYGQMHKHINKEWNGYFHLKGSNAADATHGSQSRSIICNAIKAQAHTMSETARHQECGEIIGIPLDAITNIDLDNVEQVTTYQMAIASLTEFTNEKLIENHRNRVEYLRRKYPSMSYPDNVALFELPEINEDTPKDRVSSRINHYAARLLAQLKTLDCTPKFSLDGFADYIESYIEDHVQIQSDTADEEIPKILQFFEDIAPGSQKDISQASLKFAENRALIRLLGGKVAEHSAALNWLERS